MRFPLAGCALLFAALAAREAAGWSTPANVSNMGSGQRAFGPRAVRDNGGGLQLVWAGGNDPSQNWKVWHQAYNGSTWTTPLALTGGGASRPDIVVDGNNVLHACYESPGEDNIWYRRRTGDTWSSPVNLMTGGRSISPHIAVDPSGNSILVAWHEDGQVGGEWDILAKIHANGIWTGPENVSSDSALSSEARVAIDSGGSFHLLWQSNLSEIYYRKRDPGGTWGAKTRLDHTSLRSGVGDITVSSDNIVHVVFSEDDGTGWEVFYRRFDGSNWSPPVNLSNHPGVSDDVRPAVAADAYNRLYVAWDDLNDIYYCSKPSTGADWTAREGVVTGKYGANAPDIVADGGNVHVLWQSRPAEPDNWNVYYSYQATSPPGPTGTVAGAVRDQYGQGVSGVVVVVGSTHTAVSGAGGGYSVVVPVGSYGATANKTYYAGQTVPGVTVLENQTTTVDFFVSGQPPSLVAVFAATPDNQTNTLNWTNSSSANTGGLMIRFSTTGYPAGPTDGALLLDQAATPGSTGTYLHNSLTNGTRYYYSAFNYFADASRFYAAGAGASGTPAAPADTDRDGDVDQSDFGEFQLCLSGALTAYPAGCGWADFDDDQDVDQDDWASFMVCLAGPGIASDPSCAP